MKRLAVLLSLSLADSPALSAGLDDEVQILNNLFDGTALRGARTPLVAEQSAQPEVIPDEAQRTLDALFLALPVASQTWPGYDFLKKPFLATLKDGTAILIGHPTPPAGFRPISYSSGATVYFSERAPDIGFSFKLDYDFHGARVTAVRQGSDDSPENLVRFAVHERFHEHQSGWFSGYAPYRVEEAEDIALAALEHRALAHWLKTGDSEAMRDFASLRLRRRSLFPDSSAEGFEENMEGTARYVDQEAFAAMAGVAASEQSLLDALQKPVVLEDMPKWRHYAIGAVLGRFLESQEPGAWQRDVEKGRFISELVLKRLGVPDQEASDRAARLTATSEYAKFLSEARRGIQELQQYRADLRRRFYALPGMRIKWVPTRDSYFSGRWLDYPDGLSLFDSVEWVENGPNWSLRLEGIMAGWADDLEFVLASGARVVIDGSDWNPEIGARRFATLAVSAPGVQLSVTNGHLKYDGRSVTIGFGPAGEELNAEAAPDDSQRMSMHPSRKHPDLSWHSCQTWPY